MVSGGRSDSVVEEEVQLDGAAGEEQEELLVLNGHFTPVFPPPRQVGGSDQT